MQSDKVSIPYRHMVVPHMLLCLLHLLGRLHVRVLCEHFCGCPRLLGRVRTDRSHFCVLECAKYASTTKERIVLLPIMILFMTCDYLKSSNPYTLSTTRAGQRHIRLVECLGYNRARVYLRLAHCLPRAATPLLGVSRQAS